MARLTDIFGKLLDRDAGLDAADIAWLRTSRLNGMSRELDSAILATVAAMPAIFSTIWRSGISPLRR